jgi:hypothetical protein
VISTAGSRHTNLGITADAPSGTPFALVDMLAPKLPANPTCTGRFDQLIVIEP